MAEDFKGTLMEQGPRNYRPEYPPNHVRRHLSYWIDPKEADKIMARLIAAKAHHRATFAAAAVDSNAYFLDMMQCTDPLPKVTPGDVWCGILNDDEPDRGGAKGPTFFDQKGLLGLIRLAKSIVVNSAGVNPEIYAIAPELTAKRRMNCLLIETTPAFEREWYALVRENVRDARHTLVTPVPLNPERVRFLQTTGGPHVETPQ